MMSGRGSLFSALVFAFLFGPLARAETLSCQLLMFGPSHQILPETNLVRGVQELMSSTADSKKVLAVEVLQFLLQKLQPSQSAALARMHEAGKIIAETQGLSNGNLSSLKKSLQSSEIKEIELLVSEVDKLKQRAFQLDIFEAELMRYEQSHHRVIEQLQRDLKYLKDLKVWLAELSEPREIRRSGAILVEIESHIAVFENQIQILDRLFFKIEESYRVLVEIRASIQNFLFTEWPFFLSEHRGLDRRFTNLQPRQLLENQRRQAFSRPFLVGDRIVFAGESSLRKPGLFAGQIIEGLANDGVYTKVTLYRFLFRQSIKGSWLWGRKTKAQKIIESYDEIFDLNPNAIWKHGREAQMNVPDVDLVISGRGQGEPTRFEVFPFLADPNLEIDGFRVGQSLEVDLKRVIEAPEGVGLAFLLSREIGKSYRYGEVEILKKMQFGPIASEIDYAKREILGDGTKVLKEWITSKQSRKFVEILGTNPLNNTILVAFWSANSLTGKVSPLQFRKILRRDLRFLKNYDDLFFHWPELEGKPNIKDEVKEAS